MAISRYYRSIRRWPFLLICLVFGACFGLFTFSLVKHGVPSFDDPLTGFEVRGSELANRQNAWQLLSEATSWNGLLSLYPKVLDKQEPETEDGLSATTSSPKNTSTEDQDEDNQEKMYNIFESKNHNLSDSGDYFCGKIIEDYVHVIVETVDGSSLFELQSIQNLCKLDKFILRMEHLQGGMRKDQTIQDYCEVKNSGDCCPSWSLANYLLQFANKTECDQLTENDLFSLVDHLDYCASMFTDNSLTDDCGSKDSECASVPEICFSNHNLVFNVFTYLVDYRFMDMHKHIYSSNETILTYEDDEYEHPNKTIPLPFLQSTSIFLPIAKSSSLMPYFDAINSKSHFPPNASFLSFGNVRIVAADFGLKHILFSRYLVSDLILTLIAGLVILLLLLYYTQSVCLTVVALASIGASLASAYFIYTDVFCIEFFPFLNLLSVIVLIGKTVV